MTSIGVIVGKPLEIRRLRTLLPDNTKVVLYDTLAKDKRSRVDIFKGIKALTVLYEGTIDGKKQGHYVCLIPRAHSIEYFSSLGRSPTDELNAFHEDNTVFAKLLGKNYTYNRRKMQLDSYSVDDCGYWCIARSILSHLKLAAFQKLFTPRSLKSSDEVLGLMSLLLANR